MDITEKHSCVGSRHFSGCFKRSIGAWQWFSILGSLGIFIFCFYLPRMDSHSILHLRSDTFYTWTSCAWGSNRSRRYPNRSFLLFPFVIHVQEKGLNEEARFFPYDIACLGISGEDCK